MAESIVQVTEGSGKKLHTFNRTIGANSVEDEVIVLGEQYLASYGAGTQAQVSVATANSHLFQLMAGASLNVYVREIRVYQAAVATAAAINFLAIFRLTTAGTGGTAITPQPHDTTDAASGAAAMSLPTAKGTEAAAWIDGAEVYWLQTMPTAVEFQPLRAKWTFGEPGSKLKALRIPAGTANGICVKNLTANAAATCIVVCEFSEANF